MAMRNNPYNQPSNVLYQPRIRQSQEPVKLPGVHSLMQGQLPATSGLKWPEVVHNLCRIMSFVAFMSSDRAFRCVTKVHDLNIKNFQKQARCSICDEEYVSVNAHSVVEHLFGRPCLQRLTQLCHTDQEGKRWLFNCKQCGEDLGNFEPMKFYAHIRSEACMIKFGPHYGKFVATLHKADGFDIVHNPL